MPGQVWAILMEGSDDPDEVADVEIGLIKLTPIKRAFLLLLTYGYSATEAIQRSGIAVSRGKGSNQTRIKREILKELTEVINGKDEEK